MVVLSLLSLVITPDGFVPSNTESVLLDPSFHYPLGTDSMGRNYLSRLIVGLKVSLLVALGSSLVSLVIGVLLGTYLVSTSAGTRFLSSRTVDILQGLPSFMIMAILMQAMQTSSPIVLAILMGLFHWPGIARLTQAETLKVQSESYVEAAVAMGATRFYIFRKHIWPACYSLWLAWFCYHLPGEIMFESSLSFLGFGVQPPQASLGILIQEAWSYLGESPLFLLAPATLMFILVFSLYKIKLIKSITH